MSTAPIHGTETVEEIIRHRLSQAVGGWRGSLVTALPTIAFVAGWTLTKEVRPSLIAAGVAAVGGGVDTAAALGGIAGDECA